ncbi:MAG: hypothetical protein WA705_21930 [Candidatus Ozemobacteraceae bacterium]
MNKRNYIGNGVMILLWSWFGGLLFLWLSPHFSAASSLLAKTGLFFIILRGLSMWLSGMVLGTLHAMEYVELVRGRPCYYHDTKPSFLNFIIVVFTLISALLTLSFNVFGIYTVFIDSIWLGFLTMIIGLVSAIYGMFAYEKEIRKSL